MTLGHLANALLAALISPPCVVCGRVLEEPLRGAVCPTCWHVIARGPGSVFQASASVTKSCAIGPYEGTLRNVIHALKYDGRRSVAPRLASLMATQARELLDGANVVVPVPLHRSRQRERGFNQAEDLARGLGLPVSCALRRIKSTRPQVDLPASERKRNVQDAFALNRPLATHRIIVLVDDVTTTGATLEACARVLIAAGAQEVRAITAARVASEPHSTRRQ